MRGSSTGLTLNVKVSLFGAGIVLIAVAALAALAAWQSGRYNDLCQSEVDGLIDADLDHITLGIYNLVQTENEAVQQQVNANLNLAQHLLAGAGGVSLATESVSWAAVNQLSDERTAIRLPKMLLGGRWLGNNPDPTVETPVVDEVTRLVGASATVFQRMNPRGDMLRVATTVKTAEGLRAVGTYIPAIYPDGTANPVIESVMRGEAYSGRAYVVNTYYLTAYDAIRDTGGGVVGMLYVGVKLANVEARVRQAILRTPVGRTGYVYVLGGTGKERGRYIISQRGERDGEDIWGSTDSDGRPVIQEIVRKAVALRPGELATEHYRWQNPGESAPRLKVVRLAYFEPWDWVIGASVYEDELRGYRTILNEGRQRMTAFMGAAGFVITALMGLLGAFLAWTIVGPVRRLTAAAETIIGGNLDGTVDVRSRDEIGVLARTFNIMTERLKRTMEGLRQSEEKYRGIFENAIEGFFQSSLEGRFLIVNPAMAGVLGYDSPADLMERVTDVRRQLYVRPEDRDEVITLLEEWPVVRREVQFRRKDGGAIWVSLSDRLVHDGNGKPCHIEGFIYDITERKRGDSELALERSLLRALLENIPDSIYFKDADSCFIRTSRAHARMFGLSDATEAIGKTDMDFFSGEHARKAYEDEQRIIRTGEPLVNVEEKETWPNRPATWALTTKMPLRDHEGNIIGTFGISRDITEHKRAEKRILSLAHFPDENPHPVMRVTTDGSIIYANKASEPLTSSWAGAGVDRKIPGEYLHAVTLAWKSGEKREIEIREASRTYTISVVPFADAGYVNLYGRDVTVEKTLAERLNQAQKMEAIGQLTGGIAHDFNNVLQAITGFCELLRAGLSDENQQYVAEITKATKRAATLTTQLLAFSRKQILRPRVVNTKDLIRSMHKMLERVIGEDIELRTLIDPNTGNFLADPGQMEQVLLNLAVNARDAMPSGGKLTIETSNRAFDEAYVHDHPGAKTGQYVRIAVSDTGVGMDQETLSHIYEPFFTTKEKGKGTGLGLSTVYGIVEQSEGYINCYSEMGKGTTFTIYLPLTLEEAEKPLAAASGKIAPRGTETILLVDDDKAVRSVARIALEEAGYVVFEASGGEEALSDVLARGITVALLATDVVMPRMSGKELAKKLDEICPGVRVLYASGYTANVISHHGILETGVDFLQKPFSSLELLTKVREILDREVSP